MADTIPFYADPIGESTLHMGPSGSDPFFVSNVAMVSVRSRNLFDTQGTKGKNFGRKKFLGIDLAAFTVTWVILPEEEEAFWRDIFPLARQKGTNGNAPPMTVVNPQVNRAGVTLCTVLDIAVDPPSPRGERQIVLQLEEWTPAPVAPKPDESAQGIQPGQTVLATDTAATNG